MGSTVFFLKVRPVNKQGHATMLGTQVRMFEAGTRVIAGGGLRYIDGGSGFGGQNSYDAYFGLGDAVKKGAKAFDVELRCPGGEWLSKSTDPKLGGVAPNQVLVAKC